ncbi:hypothetical protein [Catenuloplanes indicus]|uniref:Uncharacterized protein n=1 Tax=Catenuloplanes indicus TaxID=137267 RepID=A0AAE4B2N0_9ACTN|nr:hypothetical protein [Catenuloplanes indicus]MDQ0370861.1 hypothetical protein [Catenuloplanes indicus]
MTTYALYAWGNFIYEVGLDRHPEWLDPALLRGERDELNDHLTILDTGTLRVDGPGTIFEIGDERVEGRTLLGREPADGEWRVVRIRVATDGTREDALRITTMLEAEADVYAEDTPARNPLPFGEVDTFWTDDHGQWDLALVRV